MCKYKLFKLDPALSVVLLQEGYCCQNPRLHAFNKHVERLIKISTTLFIIYFLIFHMHATNSLYGDFNQREKRKYIPVHVGNKITFHEFESG